MTMKKFGFVPLVALVACGACSESPTTPALDQDVPGEITSVVLTQGVIAPDPVGSVRVRLSNSTLQDAAPDLGGSTTTRLALNGTACSEHPVRFVKISYTLTGNQASEASVRINRTWDWNGSAFVGSDDQLLVIDAKSGGGTDSYEVEITVSNSAGTGSGTTQFVVEPFGLVTETSDPPGQRLALAASANATVYVTFNDCTPSNTEPSLTVPSDITAEALSSSGTAVNFSVSATDAEDDDSDLNVVCKVGSDVVESGDVFPIGESKVECSVEDSGGLTDEGSFFVYIQDTTAPVFTSIPSTTQEIVAADINGAALNLASFGIAAMDFAMGANSGPEVSGPATVVCTIGGDDADGYQVQIGQQVTVVCTASDKAAYRAPGSAAVPVPNSASASFTILVTLDVSDVGGFLSPLRNGDGPFSAHKLKSTIPHKFNAPKYADGTLATDLAGGLNLSLAWLSGEEVDGLVAIDDPATGSTAWRYDADSGHYIFNAQTATGWKTGTWTTKATYAGVVLAETKLVLRK